VSEEPELARYLAIAVTPLRRVYDLTRREDLLELRALAVNICRAAGHEAVLSRDVIADFAKHYIMRRAGEDWVDVDDVGEARERLRRYIPMLGKLIELVMAGLINEVGTVINTILNKLGGAESVRGLLGQALDRLGGGDLDGAINTARAAIEDLRDAAIKEGGTWVDGALSDVGRLNELVNKLAVLNALSKLAK
jgi:hypothetical protein